MGRQLEILANIATLVVAMLAGIVLVKNHLFTTASGAPPMIGVGTRASVPGIDWRLKGSTLVLALDPDCHFCTESAAFYRRLASELRDRPVQLTALFSDTVENGNEYLKSLGLQVSDVRQVSFATLHIPGTPTLMFIDDEGLIQNVWMGKLSPEAEREVIEAVNRKIKERNEP